MWLSSRNVCPLSCTTQTKTLTHLYNHCFIALQVVKNILRLVLVRSTAFSALHQCIYLQTTFLSAKFSRLAPGPSAAILTTLTVVSVTLKRPGAPAYTTDPRLCLSKYVHVYLCLCGAVWKMLYLLLPYIWLLIRPTLTGLCRNSQIP